MADTSNKGFVNVMMDVDHSTRQSPRIKAVPSPNPSSIDVEKHAASGVSKSQQTSTGHNDADAPVQHPDGETTMWKQRLQWIETTLLRYNVEARGIERVSPDERHVASKFGFLKILFFWTSINLEAVVTTLGILGPTVYYLPFLDCCLLGVFGAFIGTLPAAYIATFGPRSGLRTMAFSRFVMGWWPSKLIVILTLIIYLGYSLIDAVVGGQILSAVSPDYSLSVVVGIVIVMIITWVITVFGYSVFHIYERFAWIPQLIVTAILAGVAGSNFDIHGNPSAGLPANVIAGNRLSFFSLCLASQVTYAQGAADFFVYFPAKTSRVGIFIATCAGLTLSSAFTLIIGAGLGSGTASNADWMNAFEQSLGALIVEGYRPLGGFGSFCSVIVALGLIGNLVPPTYSSGIDFQALGQLWQRIPRVVWNTVAVIIPTVCAIAGRAHLATIFTNFLALMGYWVSVWFAIVLEEHLIFRKWLGRGWKWESWNDRSKLPLGLAALFAFLVGWAGAILCMAQVWYVGPLARLISEYGGDMGNYVGFSWAALVYPIARWLELRWIGK